MEDLARESVALHAQIHGKLEVKSKVELKTRKDLSLAYTPGVAQVCLEIAKDPAKVFDLTIKRNTVAVVSDGSAILGIGNLGAAAALPVMEGKAVLFKEFANVDAFPICLDTQDVDEIVRVVRAIAPVFGGINLEDISAPRCFDVEARLQDLGIPVFHDDQHGTAIVVLAALLNALKVTNRKLSDCTIVFSGSGASAIACARLIQHCGQEPGDIILCDSKGIVHAGRTDLNPHKREMAAHTNRRGLAGGLSDALRGAHVFIGLSQANIVTPEMVRTMHPHPIIFAMANPTPEILPDAARAGGAVVVGTGRSDFPNQINNVLAFPGVFRGALDACATAVNEDMKLAAAHALASYVIEPTPERVLPDPLDKKVAYQVGTAVADAARRTGVCRR
ncbi:MAG: NADP-dependent malic enzyme [Deltaproteobacteria bacterium]|nr:NADP-dependent malic enzyme [Deltaproteobacteria bacterium]MBI3389122.1 NADP-dependent malic enzyme [Deltaproteobacteria bacterium]